MKKLLSIVLTLTFTLSLLVSPKAVATEGATLNLAEEVAVTDDVITFAFTTEESGPYLIYSSGNTPLCADLKNANGETITYKYCNAENGMDFRIELVLAASTTYSLRIENRYPSTYSANYTLRAERLPCADIPDTQLDVGFNQNGVYHSFTPDTDGYYIIHTTGSLDTYGELYDNGSLICYDDNFGGNGNYRLEYYLSAGKEYTVFTKIWSSPNEPEAAIRVVPFVADRSVTENERHTVADKWDILSFVPTKTSFYRFYSLAEENSSSEYYGRIYNSDFEIISEVNYELYSPNNFYVECDMTAGETYYLDAMALWESELSPEVFEVTVSEIPPITQLEIVPTNGSSAGVNEDLYFELLISPETYKSEEIFWSIEPARVGRIEYSGNWGASIELHSPGFATVTAYTQSGVSTTYDITCEGELPELIAEQTLDVFMEYPTETHSFSFTANEEGMYGILSRGDDLDLKVAVYEELSTAPFKSESRRGAGDNFNIQFFNSEPGKRYIVEVTTEYDEYDYPSQGGSYEIMAYKCTEGLEGIELSVGESYTVYNEAQDYEFSVSLLPETANQYELDFAVWQLKGDDIAFSTVYGRNYSCYRFYATGTATLTVSICDGTISDSCVIECKEVGYSDILLDEVKAVDPSAHYCEGWFRFIPEEDGNYTFFSTGDMDIDMYSEDNYCDYDSGYRYNFLYSVELAAGEAFYFECYPYGEFDNGKYYVSVCRTHYAESVSIIEHPLSTVELFGYGYYDLKFGNGGALYDNIYEILWSISDPSVAEFYETNGDNVILRYIGEGVTTLTATTPDGLTASYTVYVGIEPPAEQLSGDINGDATFDVKDLITLKKLAAGVISSNISADLNSDGSVNADDIVIIRKLLLTI